MRALVRVLDQNGTVRGAGFLAGPRPVVITCAHVVDKVDPQNSGRIGVELYSTKERLICRVLVEQFRGQDAEDVAALEILLPAEQLAALPRVTLGTSFAAMRQPLHTFGFPSARKGEGLGALCVAVDRLKEGGFDALQLQTGEVTHGFSGAPVWIENTGFVVGMAMSIVTPDRAGRLGNTAFIRTTEVIRSVCDLDLEPGEPYRGLGAFEESMSGWYFGRDPEIKGLVSLLDSNDVVLVTGVSGSGKSSLIRAGLEKGLSQWNPPALAGGRRILLTPTLTPLASLIHEAMPLFPDHEAVFKELLAKAKANTADILAAERASDIAGIATAMKTAAALQPVIFVVDQFERLFTNCPDDEVRRRFMDFIRNAASGRVRFVIGLRLDYYERAQDYALFKESGEAVIVLQQMTEAALVEAIEKPAMQLGRQFEPKAVEALVDDVKDRPGDLPLLQFALTELWDKDNQSGVLTFDSYTKLGYETPEQKITGAQGAIIKRAEGEWHHLHSADGRAEPVEFGKLFLKLVQVAPNLSGPMLSSSRRAWVSELDESTRKTAEALANSFLLTNSRDPVSGQPTIEVAHEALIRNWSKLRVLIQQDSKFIMWYSNEFGFELQKWIRNGKHRLTGKALAEAERWQRQMPAMLAGAAEDFIAASRRTRAWKHATPIAVLGAALAVLIGFLYVKAKDEETFADDLQQQGVRALAEHDFQAAEILLARSLNVRDTPDARQHLLEARVNGYPIVREVPAGGKFVAFSNSGRWAIVDTKNGIEVLQTRTSQVHKTPITFDEHSRYAVTDDGSVLVYAVDIKGTRPDDGDRAAIHAISLGTADLRELWTRTAKSSVDSLAFSGNGDYLAVGRIDGMIELRNAHSGELESSNQAHRLAVHCVRFHPTKLLIASGGADRAVRLWDGGKNASELLGTHGDFVGALSFSKDGSELASGGADGSVRLWSVEKKVPVTAFTGHLGTVASVAIMRNGVVLSGSDDKTLRMWDSETGSELAQFAGDDGVDAVFANDEDDQAAAISGGVIRYWDIGRHDEGFTIYNSAPVDTVAFSPDGATLAAGGEDGDIRFWSLDGKPTGKLLEIKSPSPAIWSIAYTREGRHLISGGEDGVIRLWDLQSAQAREWPFAEDIIKARLAGNVWSIAVHPSKPIVAFGVAAADMSRIHVMDLETWTQKSRIEHPSGSVYALSFSPDGNLLAAGGGDSTVILYDVSDPAHPKVTDHQVNIHGEIWGVPFAPDGKSLATAGLDRHVRIWSVPDLKRKEEFSSRDDHQGLVQSAVFGPKGEWVATASIDRTVKLWNVQTRKVIPVGGHTGPSWWVTFDPQGNRFMSGGLDRRIIVRDLQKIASIFQAPVNNLLKDARGHTCRDLPEQSFWQRLLPDSQSDQAKTLKYVGCNH